MEEIAVFNGPMLVPDPPEILHTIAGIGFNYTFGEAIGANEEQVVVSYYLGAASTFIKMD